EHLDDSRMQLAVDERGERAVRIVEILLELRAQAGERVAHERTGLEALDQSASQALGLRERVGAAGRETPGEARDPAQGDASERMLRIAGGVRELGGGVVARGLDESALEELPSQDERHEALPALAQRTRRAVEPPVELLRRARALRQVGERGRE